MRQFRFWPRATTDFRLPPELYSYELKKFGNNMAPEELISRAKTSFREIQNGMNTLAPLVAGKRDLAPRITTMSFAS